ncbi:MAG: zinc ribbon domain-containing protein, partial [Microthrixaceae bacterium]
LGQNRESDGVTTMPLYEYRCKNCGHQFDIQQSISEDSLTVCPNCDQAELRKVFQPVGISFKGSGFYKNDSRSSGSSSSKSSSKGASDPGSSSSDSSGSTSSGSSTTESSGSGSSGSSASSTSSTSTSSTSTSSD